MRGEDTRERKSASVWDQTHNHKVMSLTCSQLSHTGGAIKMESHVLRSITASGETKLR